MNFLKNFRISFVLIALSVFMVACGGEYPGFKKTKTGVYYKIHTSKNEDTTKVRLNTIVTVDLKYGKKDSLLFDSRENPMPLMLPVAVPQYEGDIYECMSMLNQGDSATFVLKAGPLFTQTFGGSVPEFLTEETDLYFDIKILKVQTQEEIDREMEIRNMELEKEEMARLEQYVKSNNITTEPGSSGIYFMETRPGKGKAIEMGNYAKLHYTVSLLGGEQLFSTRDTDEPIDIKFGSQYENPGFMEILGMLREGGRANAIVPSSMAFGPQGAGNGLVPPFSTLYYDMELIKILTKAEFDAQQNEKEALKREEAARKEVDEQLNMQKYMKEKNIMPTVTSLTGLVYIEQVRGTGPEAEPGKKVKVHYTGTLLDGTKFDSSLDRGEPFEFVPGNNQVIEGWDEGILLMNVGTKATLIVPSKLAYKDRGAGKLIKPYSTLVFEIELLEVEK